MHDMVLLFTFEGDVRLRVTLDTEKSNLHPQDRKLLESRSSL